ncbi:MAG: (d)CMP kinase [Armatimonadetes bacterium]|nr:(d)CMP kinase [Armatimonadota bacterium]
MKPQTVAIDGPAGAGKSTVARLLAAQLGFLYVDSGAMYRAVALKVRENAIDPADETAVAMLARTVRIVFVPGDTADAEQGVHVDGSDVTTAIRVPEIASLASVVSAIPGVRSALVTQQQALGTQGGVVMEGRDIGTVVFPHAEVKVFLTASPDERAVRRHKDILSRGVDTTIDAVRADQDERDGRDASRAVSPLTVAPDALEISSDGKTPEQIVGEILRHIETLRSEG